MSRACVSKEEESGNHVRRHSKQHADHTRDGRHDSGSSSKRASKGKSHTVNVGAELSEHRVCRATNAAKQDKVKRGNSSPQESQVQEFG